jgi:murein DD-endopeptidase MepM/ murein hydrolase activator NlpD
MRKKPLLEELKRIHEITYGRELMNEQNFLQKLFGKKDNSTEPTTGTTTSATPEKKIDDPKKADMVSDDVNAFYKNIEDAIKGGGLSQQSGGISYQKEVESMQIGLKILGYELPRFGVDGLFGSETASAVTKFIGEKLGTKTGTTVNEAVNLTSVGGGSLIGYPGQGTHSAEGWANNNAWDVAAPTGTDVYSITNGTVVSFLKGDGSMKKSGVKKIYGDQVKVQSNDGKPDVFYTHIDSNLQKGNSVKEGDVIGKIMTLPGMPSHVHVALSSGNLSDYANGLTKATGGSGGSPSAASVKATPEMLTKLLELLKAKPVTSEELKKHIDTAVTSGGGANFTDLDLNTDEGYRAYAEICSKFISSRPPNLLGITGEMMAKAAKEAFTNYRKYVPPELALAQMAAEGGIGNRDPNSRPIRTKNPFNVGNTDSGANIYHGTVEGGIQRYYNLIAKDYLVQGKTASDLVKHFVNKNGNRYATAAYEPVVNKIAAEANRIAAPIYASLSKKPGTTGSDTMTA